MNPAGEVFSRHRSAAVSARTSRSAFADATVCVAGGMLRRSFRTLRERPMAGKTSIGLHPSRTQLIPELKRRSFGKSGKSPFFIRSQRSERGWINPSRPSLPRFLLLKFDVPRPHTSRARGGTGPVFGMDTAVAEGKFAV